MVLANLQLYIICAALITNLITGMGWYISANRLDAYKTKVTKEKVEEQERVVKLINEANKINAALISRVNASEQALSEQKMEKDNELRKITSNTKCFNSATVSMLNSSGMRSPQPSVIPEDGRSSSDTDVAIWITGAKRAYEVCRGRLNAIADFYELNKPESKGIN
jgi:hypothetical protein